MDLEQRLEQAELYALGVLEGKELKEFEAYLADGSPTCEVRIREVTEALTLLPKSLDLVQPPAHIQQELMQKITEAGGVQTLPETDVSSGAQAVTKPTWSMPVLGGLTLGGLAIAASVIYILTGNLNEEQPQLVPEVSLTEQIEDFSDQLTRVKETEEMLSLMSSPDVNVVELESQMEGMDGSAKVFWNDAKKEGMIMTKDLPKEAQDQIYELWAIEDGKDPVSAGAFSVDENGNASMKLLSIPADLNFGKFAVTLEPQDGNPAPNGVMYLVGTV